MTTLNILDEHASDFILSQVHLFSRFLATCAIILFNPLSNQTILICADIHLKKNYSYTMNAVHPPKLAETSEEDFIPLYA